MAQLRARHQLPELTADLIGEIVLRLPPSDPACLVRASLVCNLWHGIISDSTFPRRYREFHRTAPMLGFFNNLYCGIVCTPRFVPIMAASPIPHHNNCFGSQVLDCRHGRVLLLHDMCSRKFTVWDPISNHRQQLPEPGITYTRMGNTAMVLCGADGCDHLDCHGGPFLVLLVCSYCPALYTSAWVYSSKTGAWGTPVSVQSGSNYFGNFTRSTLIEDKIYSMFRRDAIILMYDMGKHYLSTINSPDHCEEDGNVLMSLEDGSLGLAYSKNLSLYLWSTKVNPDGGVAKWMQCRVIELDKLIPNIKSHISQALVVGFAEGVCAILVDCITVGTFMIELKSVRVRKIDQFTDFVFLPFTSFYTPDCASRKLSSASEIN